MTPLERYRAACKIVAPGEPTTIGEQVLLKVIRDCRPAEAVLLSRVIESVEGQERDRRRGHPEHPDDESLGRVLEAIASGKHRKDAIGIEAQRCARADGKSIETHAHRLREKLRRRFPEAIRI